MDGILALLLVAAVMVVYWPALHGGFVWDDDSHISDNPTLRSLKGLWEIWFQPGATCQYYPLSFTGFWIGYQLWGLHTPGYHLITVALHGTGAVLLWQVLKRLEVRAAWLAGAIFALHPVNVMSVAWMTELKNTLSGVLILGAAWAYLRFAGLGVYGRTAVPSGADWRYGLLSLALFQLAMFAKTAVSFLPVTLVLLVWWKRGRLTWRSAWPLLAMFGIAVGMGLLTLRVEHLHGATGDEFRMGWRERVLVSGRSFWFYLGKLFYPHPLIFIYERWKINAGAWWQYVYPAATLGMFSGLWLWRKRIGKGIFVALLHFYITTSLIVLIQVLYMMRYTFVTDHWQYYGCMGVFAVAAAGIAGALSRWGLWGKPWGVLMLTGLLLTLATLSWRQCAMYADAETFWQTTLRRNPDCPMACNNLGQIFFQQGRLDEAMAQYQKALALQPDFSEVFNNLGSVLLQQGRLDEATAQFLKMLAINPDSADAHYNLGNALFRQGRTDEAIAHYQKALAIKPDFVEAHNNLGNALLQQGRLDEAIAQYQQTLALKPDYAEAHNNMGSAMFQQGRLDEAITHFQKALAIKPDYAKAHYNLGNTLFQQGRLAEAVAHYQKALAMKPDYADVQNKLAWVLATCPQASLRNGDQAVELAQRANQLTGDDNPVILCTLAAACAEAGRFPEATATAQRALPLAEAQSNRGLVDELRFQLKLYQAGLPFHNAEPTPSAHAGP